MQTIINAETFSVLNLNSHTHNADDNRRKTTLFPIIFFENAPQILFYEMIDKKQANDEDKRSAEKET